MAWKQRLPIVICIIIGTFFPSPCKYGGSPSSVFPLCVLMSLLGPLSHIYKCHESASQTSLLPTRHFDVDIPQGPKAQHVRSEFNFSYPTTLLPTPHVPSRSMTQPSLCCSAQKSGVPLPFCPMSSLPPTHPPHHCKMIYNQRWNINISHSPPLISVFLPFPLLFLPNFHTFQWPLQCLRMKFKVLKCSEPCFFPNSICLASVFLKTLFFLQTPL